MISSIVFIILKILALSLAIYFLIKPPLSLKTIGIILAISTAIVVGYELISTITNFLSKILSIIFKLIIFTILFTILLIKFLNFDIIMALKIGFILSVIIEIITLIKDIFDFFFKR